MSFDSLAGDIDRAIDGALAASIREQIVPSVVPPLMKVLGVLRHSQSVINDARNILSTDVAPLLDYRSFIRFLADTPVPMLTENELRLMGFLGSGWTMSVHRGECSLGGAKQLVAIK